MFRHVVHRRKNSGFTGPFGLVLAPTRELAIQIYDQVQLFGVKALHLRVACLVGGSDAQQASSQLNRGADIIIATPGRLIEVLGMRKGRALELKHVSFVVLDEADRIFDGGFEPQVARILAAAHPGRQIGMFSATFPPIVQKVANRFLSANSIEIRFGGRFVIPNTIKQVVEVVSETTKLFRLVDILRQHQKEAVLVFVSDQDSAELLSVALKSTFEIQNVTLLHAGLDMEDRVDALSTFQDAARAKVKSSRVLVATSLASRGLHLPEISLVINYDCPSHTEDYVHKVGRTGRAGASGTAITFITKDDDAHVSNLGKLLKKCGVTDLPVELATMAEEFERKCQAGEANRPSRGFGKGSGDEKKTQLAQMQQIAQRARFGEEYDLDIVPATETPDKGAVELQESDPIPLPAAESAAKALLRKFSMKTGLVVAPKSPECQLTTGKFPINDMAQYVRRGLIDCIRGRGVEGDDFGDSVLSLKGVFQPPSLNSRKPASEDKKEEPLHILIEAETPRDLMIAEQALRRRTAELAASPRAMVEMNVSKRF
jgi:ATP-dependent RNA helicase DDX46/PRP5